MYLSLVNLLPVLLTFSTAFGVFMHDSQLDRASVTAFTAPLVSTVNTSADVSLKFNDLHVHTETQDQLQNSQPSSQARNEDKKYIVNKKLVSNSSGSDYSWPSI